MRGAPRPAARGSASRRSPIVFLHSYLNPAHELRGPRASSCEEYPDVELISLSHEVLPEAARVRAHVDHARERVRRPADRALPRPARPSRLAEAGYRQRAAGRHLGRRCRHPRADRPSGRSPPSARDRPVGVAAAARAARPAGLGDVVSVDMGGTSYDVCLIRGRPARDQDATGTGATGTASRSRWSTSTSVGAGGGSIVGERRRGAAGRPAVGGEPTRSGLLRPGRHRADDHRRRPRARPARPRRVRQRPHDARSRGRASPHSARLGHRVGLDAEETAAAACGSSTPT